MKKFKDLLLNDTHLLVFAKSSAILVVYGGDAVYTADALSLSHMNQVARVCTRALASSWEAVCQCLVCVLARDSKTDYLRFGDTNT